MHGEDDVTTARLEIPTAALKALDAKLSGMQGIQQSKILLDGMRAAGRAVRKRAHEIAPVAASENYKRKPGKASLRTVPAYKIKAFVRELEPILEVRVKAAKRAPHFHLIELGRRIVVRGTAERTGGKRKAAKSKRTGERGKGTVIGKVDPKPFISLGGKYSNREQVAEMQKAIQKAISKLIGA